MDPSNPAQDTSLSAWNRHLVIVGGVVVLHAVALWGLHTGLLRRVAEIVVPAQLIAEFVEPPRPVVAPSPVLVPPTIIAKPKQAVKPVAPAAVPQLQLQAVVIPDPAPNAPTAIATSPAPAPPILSNQAEVSKLPDLVGVAPPSPLARFELPSSDAEYLQNPATPYPKLSKALGETGIVLVDVHVGADGSALKTGLRESSGFNRLDQAAVLAVLKWRFVPGKRAGVPEAMWYIVPIHFDLK